MITFLSVLKFQFSGISLPLVSILLEVKVNPVSMCHQSLYSEVIQGNVKQLTL